MRAMLSGAVLVLLFAGGCMGALAGGTFGGASPVFVSAPFVTRGCDACHAVGAPASKRWVGGTLQDPRTNDVVGQLDHVIVAPDLFSPEWRRKIEAMFPPEQLRSEAQAMVGSAMCASFDQCVDTLHATNMQIAVETSCFYGRQVYEDGSRVTFKNDQRTTMDGLPLWTPEETTKRLVTVMGGCRFQEGEQSAVERAISCHHYPNIALCRRPR